MNQQELRENLKEVLLNAYHKAIHDIATGKIKIERDPQHDELSELPKGTIP